MTRIGLISDTHSFLNPKVKEYFSACDEIWHAGDIGDIQVMDELAAFKKVRAVHGNIDDNVVRSVYPRNQRFKCEQVDVWLTHIGGYPNRYSPFVKEEIVKNPPNLFICGHSHILKIMYDKKLDLLHLNPGAAGNYGIHKVITLLRFTIDKSDIKDMEIIELGNR